MMLHGIESPNVIKGNTLEVNISTDGGLTWTIIGDMNTEYGSSTVDGINDTMTFVQSFLNFM